MIAKYRELCTRVITCFGAKGKPYIERDLLRAGAGVSLFIYIYIHNHTQQKQGNRVQNGRWASVADDAWNL